MKGRIVKYHRLGGSPCWSSTPTMAISCHICHPGWNVWWKKSQTSWWFTGSSTVQKYPKSIKVPSWDSQTIQASDHGHLHISICLSGNKEAIPKWGYHHRWKWATLRICNQFLMEMRMQTCFFVRHHNETGWGYHHHQQELGDAISYDPKQIYELTGDTCVKLCKYSNVHAYSPCVS